MIPTDKFRQLPQSARILLRISYKDKGQEYGLEEILHDPEDLSITAERIVNSLLLDYKQNHGIPIDPTEYYHKGFDLGETAP
jgi:hypothetical protein